MAGIISKLFVNNGRVPWLQMLLALIVGMVSSIAYVKYRQPPSLLKYMCPASSCPAPPRAQLQRPKEARPAGRRPPVVYPEVHDEEPEAEEDEGADDLVAAFPLPLYVAEHMMKTTPRSPPKPAMEEVDDDEGEEEAAGE